MQRISPSTETDDGKGKTEMLKITVACVGKLKESYWREAVAEYQKRLQSYCSLDIVEVEEAPVPQKASQAQIDAALETEGKRLLSKAPAGAALCSLCIEGKEMGSERFARWLSDIQVRGTSHVVLLIGGSWGLSPEVKRASGLRLSMSPMTFPHQLARVMLLEQTYRAFQILSGGKYHK